MTEVEELCSVVLVEITGPDGSTLLDLCVERVDGGRVCQHHPDGTGPEPQRLVEHAPTADRARATFDELRDAFGLGPLFGGPPHFPPGNEAS